MADETEPATDSVVLPVQEKHPDAGFLGGLLGKLGIRGLLYNLGGRKILTGGGALGVITLIVNSSMGDWPKAIACLAVAVVAAATTFSIGHEDQGKVKGR